MITISNQWKFVFRYQRKGQQFISESQLINYLPHMLADQFFCNKRDTNKQ